jgi:hypothetical protein
MSLTMEGWTYVVTKAESIPQLVRIMESRLTHGALQISIKAWVPPKTKRQRNYLHALIAQIAAHLRVDPVALKEEIKAEMGVVVVKPSTLTGDRIAVPKSTEEYTREEYTALISMLLAWAAERGILVPGPEDYETREDIRMARTA